MAAGKGIGDAGDYASAFHRHRNQIEYALTKKGRALATAVDAIADWANKWVEPDAPAEKEQKPARIRRRA